MNTPTENTDRLDIIESIRPLLDDLNQQAAAARAIIAEGMSQLARVRARRDSAIKSLAATAEDPITDDIRLILQLIDWPCRWTDAANKLTAHDLGPKSIGAAKTLLGRAIRNRVITLADKGFYNLTEH